MACQLGIKLRDFVQAMALEDKNRAGTERAEAKAEKMSNMCKAKQKDTPAPKAKQQRAKTAYQASVVLIKSEVVDMGSRHTYFGRLNMLLQMCHSSP